MSAITHPAKVTLDDVIKATMDMARRIDERRTKELAESVFANFRPEPPKAAPRRLPHLSDEVIARCSDSGAYELAWLDLASVPADSWWKRVIGAPEVIDAKGVTTLFRRPRSQWEKVFGANSRAPKAALASGT